MIYLDHNATTPPSAAVREAVMDAQVRLFGNPSSIHEPGRLARNALDEARRQVAELVSVHARQVIFTSGGTEANNLALRGVAAGRKQGRILIGATEHSAVLGPAEALGKQGFAIEKIPCDSEGRIDPVSVEDMLDENVILVSVMFANNETGAIQDVAAISEVVRARGIVMHTDAVQAAGKLNVDFRATGANLMTLSAHKLYGPKGVGALITDGSTDFLPQVVGGGQEAGYRAGTENLPGIVGFGVAAAEAKTNCREWSAHTRKLRDALEAGLRERPGITIFGNGMERLSNTCQFAITGIDGETVQMGLDRQGIAVSTGSACHSRSAEPSHVLLAMGVDPMLARGAVRASFGKDNSQADVEALLKGIDDLLLHLPAGVMAGNVSGGPVAW